MDIVGCISSGSSVSGSVWWISWDAFLLDHLYQRVCGGYRGMHFFWIICINECVVDMGGCISSGSSVLAGMGWIWVICISSGYHLH